MGRLLAVLGAAAAALHLLGLAAEPGPLTMAAKPVPALCLGLWVARRGAGRYGALIACGLFVSAAGDLLLEWPRLFLAGLAAFLVAHLLYTAAFVADTPRLRPWRALPFAAWGAAGWAVLRPGLGALGVPVAAYMAALCTMMWRAWARVGRHGRAQPGEWAGAVGAVLFGLSDTLIAFDLFQRPLPWARYPILLLYWAGQLGIAASAGASRARAGPAAVRG